MDQPEAIILAGGLGSRLRTAVPDLPKCMAPVNGRPFLDYLIAYLLEQEVRSMVFSLGYKHELIEDYLASNYSGLSYRCSVETEPLGTGGAIRKAADIGRGKNMLVLNGDTLFRVDLAQFTEFHLKFQADCSLALKPMKDFSRYGVVELNSNHRIACFREKQFYTEGLINGGVYVLNRDHFLNENFPEKFSFEKDYLEALFLYRKMYGMVQEGYFIDIGIPEDYERASSELGPLPIGTPGK
jgi:D-glycero-alpha-D-manno-heptose 1-phosphate guanylyltransferase